MPKAKFKRKGATLPLFDPPATKKSRLSDSSERIELDKVDYSAADPEPGYTCLNKWVSDKSTNCTSKQAGYANINIITARLFQKQ